VATVSKPRLRVGPIAPTPADHVAALQELGDVINQVGGAEYPRWLARQLGDVLMRLTSPGGCAEGDVRRALALREVAGYWMTGGRS